MSETPEKRKKCKPGFDGLKAMLGLPCPRDLDLARPMRIDVGRIGYPDEGLRLTLGIDSPYQFNAEVKLSREDARWLLRRLHEELDAQKNTNMPKGKP